VPKFKVSEVLPYQYCYIYADDEEQAIAVALEKKEWIRDNEIGNIDYKAEEIKD
jgi:hypothetical protein